MATLVGKHPYEKTLLGHGFELVSSEEKANRLAPESHRYIESVYTHPNHGKSRVTVSVDTLGGSGKGHSFIHHHEQENGIMAPSAGDNPNQLHRSLSREYGVPKGMAVPKTMAWERDRPFKYRMNEATESLVDALSSGSAMGIEYSFKEAMSRRLLDTIEMERPNVVASLFDENGVFQKEEFTTEAKSNGAPAACPHCLKKVSGKGVYHNPPKVKIDLGIEQSGFYHAKCHKEKFPDAVVEEFDLMESEEVLSEMAVPWPEKAPQLNQYKRTEPGSHVYAHPDGHRIELNPDTQELTHFPAGSTKGKKFPAGADIHPYLMKLHGGFDELVKKHDADASRSWGDDMRMRHKMGSLDYAYKKAKKAGTLTPEDHAKMAVDYKAMHRAVMNGQRRERIAARAKYDAFNQTKVYKESFAPLDEVTKGPRKSLRIHSEFEEAGFTYKGRKGSFHEFEHPDGDTILHKYPTPNGNHSFKHLGPNGKTVWGVSNTSHGYITQHLREIGASRTLQKEEKEAASRCVNCGEDYHGDAEKQKYHSNCWSDAGIAARKKTGDLGESASYGTPGCAGCENDTYNGVCMDCTRARAKTATSRGGCKCGKKKVPGEVKKVGSRSWIPCDRCLGQIAQLS